MTPSGKVIWITGASSGIGEALARALAFAGARLILSARRPAQLARVKSSCTGDSSAIHVLPLDLADTDSLPDKAREALSRFGRVDILLNNAGISQRSLAKDTSIEVDRRILEVDYLGQVALTKAVLPSMIERQEGLIVVVSSMVAHMATPLRTSYSAAKNALHGFFNALRAELWQENVRVCIVCPASIRTDISRNALTGDGTVYGTMDPRQAKGMSPQECAQKIVAAIKTEKREIWVGPAVRYVALLARYFPALYARLIRSANVT